MTNASPKTSPVPSALVFYIVHITGCFLLLIPAFYNGFGIVNSDFGTYLPSGFKPAMPVDRPITYGILMRIFSLNGLSLWPVLLAQAFFVSNLVIRLTKIILQQHRHYLLYSVLILFFFSLFTGLSWTVSQLQPDIFTSIALMSAALLLMASENKLTTSLTFVLYFVAIATHASHMLLFVLLLLSLIVFYRKTLFRERKKRFAVLLALSVVPILTMLPIFPKSKHVFFMGSLLEKGILKKYLDEHCAATPWKLCAYKDQLPRSADDFLWDSNSPVHKEGGWAAVKPEYDEIIDGALSDPEYIWLYVKGSITFTLRQLIVFETGPGNIPFQKGTYVYDGLAEYVPGDLEAFRSSRQFNNTLLPELELPNMVFSWVMLISALSLAVLLARSTKNTDAGLQTFAFICICGILLNAWDCATFATINGRYGCRMMWLIPFCLLLATGRKLSDRPINNIYPAAER